mmetsp:Transcript_18292/g.33172  ORF Transcript_18292/g.33172 Transcript_18292/m.33172 type:complete len:84 (+) Transcript_18292:483-734(+)
MKHKKQQLVANNEEAVASCRVQSSRAMSHAAVLIIDTNLRIVSRESFSQMQSSVHHKEGWGIGVILSDPLMMNDRLRFLFDKQ